MEPGHQLAPVHLPVQVADVDGSAALLPFLTGAGEEAGVHGHDGSLATADAQWVSCYALPVQSQSLLHRVWVRMIASCQEGDMTLCYSLGRLPIYFHCREMGGVGVENVTHLFHRVLGAELEECEAEVLVTVACISAVLVK